MKKKSSKLLLIISGAIIFNIIFWQEKPGLNMLLFDAFIITTVFILFPYSLKNNTSKWLLAAHLITASMIIVQNTLLSGIAFIVSLLLFISFSQYIHRSAWYAGGSAVLNYVYAIPNFFKELKIINANKIKIKGLSGSLRMLLIPSFILAAFFIMYSFANVIFAEITSSIITYIQQWFEHFFDWFSPERSGFFLLGIFVVGGLILRNNNTFFSDKDLKQNNELLRKKNNLLKWKETSFADLLHVITGKPASGIMALKNEYTIGTISLLLVNVLLLFINVIDVKYVWLGFTFSKDAGIAAYVHEGAGLLIFSIVSAMLILLFFFRGNLNFYKQSKWLRSFAYLWIFQNSFLVISVLIRDYYYISHYGLAYKRIGLLFFLLMVLAGLCTVLLKIFFTKTTYYLLRINAWIAIILLVSASFFHWDETIAEYNLARKSAIPLDIPFLLSLSDNTLPLIQKNIDALATDKKDIFYYRGDYFQFDAVSFFELRKKEFLEQQKNYTWLSWNASDAYVKKELLKKAITSSLK